MADIQMYNVNQQAQLHVPCACKPGMPDFMTKHHDDMNQADLENACFPGPLMSTQMKKKDLVLYIQSNAQTCRELGEAQCYIFWQIMELFCHENGKVLLTKAAIVLFRTYRLFRNKSGETRQLHDWCLSLAKLLCADMPDDQHKEAIIKMGDDLALRELTYPAHICYMLAKVDLGARSQFELIGCRSVPIGLSVLTLAVERTEIYEYVLSLTSGLAQPDFQIFKLCHASRLAQADFFDEALLYCETIARAVITFSDKMKRSLIKRLITLCKYVLDGTEEPVWLVELFQLYKDKFADANDESEQYLSSSSSEVKYNCQNRSSGNDDNPPPQSSDLQLPSDSEDAFLSRYTVGELLGEGGFGCVYAGTRNEDGKEVAIKHVKKYDKAKNKLKAPGTLPTEVELMRIVSESPRCSNVVELLEWFDMPDYILIVMERPNPCMDLSTYVQHYNNQLSEAQAREIMLQVVQATCHCRDRGVLHRDIKPLNLLINPDTLQVKLIDFGCGDFLRDTPYRTYAGTPDYCPPEWKMFRCYKGIPATIWGLGIMLYTLVGGLHLSPFSSKNSFENGELRLHPDVSRDFLDLVMWCLEFEPDLRPSLEDVLRHEWFTQVAQDKVLVR